MFTLRIVLAGACVLYWCAGHAAEPASTPVAPPVTEASIPFAHSSIWNWRVIDDRTVLIETNSHMWYKAKLLSSCIDLPFAERIGFESNADGSFDRFSTIVAREQTCHVASLTQIPAPPKKGARKHATAPAGAD